MLKQQCLKSNKYLYVNYVMKSLNLLQGSCKNSLTNCDKACFLI
jgi:hypothetical protein